MPGREIPTLPPRGQPPTPTQVALKGGPLRPASHLHPTTMCPHLTLLPGSTDRSFRPWKTSLGAAIEAVLLSSGVVHTSPRVSKSKELMGADTGQEAGGKPKLDI